MNDRRETNLFPLLFVLAGFTLLVSGVWKIYHPAAMILAGLLLALFGLYGRSV
ncbi:MAG TPA: hypothetical protein VKP61_00090 [Candidatus Acidoferrum sp.]|nr:hypothetical protein [Candidatus Acidoferrum sp.]